jgi:TolB-like protein
MRKKEIMAEPARNYFGDGMAEQVITDSSGKELGRIRELASGRLVAHNTHGTQLGTYDPHADKTYDRLGLEIGSGNQLRWLISQAWQD